MVHEPASGAVCFTHQSPLWCVRVSVAEVVASPETCKPWVVNSALMISSARPQPAALYALYV